MAAVGKGADVNIRRWAVVVAMGVGSWGGCGGGDADGGSPLVLSEEVAPGEACASGGLRITTGVDRDGDGALVDAEIASTQVLCSAPGAPPSLVATDVEPAGENCPHGGLVVRIGVDEDRDGALSSGEVGSTQYVCNGAPGDLGSVVAVVDEPPGERCAAGGVAIHVGIDDDGDGLLAAEEYDSTSYLCHGEDGASVALRQEDEPPGERCAFGGVLLSTGMDEDEDGYLDDDEIIGSAPVCNGADGADGLVSLIRTTDALPGEPCVDGGVLVETGLDEDGDGTLDDEEVRNGRYVCHGVDGVDGADAAVAVTPEPAGGACPSGGHRVAWGADADGDGALSAGEEAGSRYVCHGADGESGSSGLVEVTPEPAGADCVAGGHRVRAGTDLDGDGVLDDGEYTESYVCDGVDGEGGGTADGSQSLVEVTPEPAGGNCTDGGQRIRTGLDADDDGALGAGEYDETYVCHGADGADGVEGATSLVEVTAEPAGGNCPDGGQRIRSGVDANRDGALGAGEYVDTFVCDGADGAGGATTLTEITDAIQGGVCPAGGAHIEIGLDANGSGALDAGEVVSSQYLCAAYFVKVETADAHACALAYEGSLFCWGINRNGELGHRPSSSQSHALPFRVALPGPASDISTAVFHTCAIVEGQVYCWGLNSGGRLGDRPFSLTQPAWTPAPVAGVTDATAIELGISHTCIVRGAGQAQCWGTDSYGETDVSAFASGVTQISAGRFHTCVVQDGAARCVGQNVNGSTVTTGLESGVTAVSAGYDFTCALQDGAALCWGSGSHGQTSTLAAVPTVVVGLESGVTRVEAGYQKACAVREGRLRCWGNGGNGALGDGAIVNRSSPVYVLGMSTGWTDVGAFGASFSCGVAYGRVYCWGANNLGQLGLTQFHTSYNVPYTSEPVGVNIAIDGLDVVGGG